jgi:tetratricopeptide (TPR) repeat protein
VALELPAGTRITAELAPGTPDEPLWRAAAIWWRESLRQSVRFDVLEAETHPSNTTVARLALDPVTKGLAAFCRQPDGTERALAGESFADGNLAAAIDRLAWATRCALGEDADTPIAIAACLSTNVRAMLAAEDGLILLRDGAIEGARRALQDARTRDGASPFVLEGLAGVALLRSDPQLAERICLEGLALESRLSPPLQHRLARTLLLARSSLHPEQAPDRDRDLLDLGLAGQRERPYDPQCALTVAIAHNFLRDFAAARVLLEPLVLRLPHHAIVAYHLGWACLATGDPAAAVVHFEAASLRLPMPWIAIPRAMALRAAGQDEALARLLEQMLADCPAEAGSLPHDLRRMQSAHALMLGNYAVAADLIEQDLNWLLAHSSVADMRGGELAEEGEVLVRLGRPQELPAVISVMQAQHPRSAVADACAYLQGLVQIATRHERLESLEGQLNRGGESVWALRLQAFAHEQRGEIADLHASLSRAARLSDSPMTKALLAKSLQTMGKVDEANALRTALRRELEAIDLRRRPQNPLLGPELAFAWSFQ